MPGFPGFEFDTSRILLTGADNPWLVAFDPDTVKNTTGSPCSSIAGSVCVQLAKDVNRKIHYIAPVPGDPTIAYLTTDNALYRLSNISFAGQANDTPKGDTKCPTTGELGPVNGDFLGNLAVSDFNRQPV